MLPPVFFRSGSKNRCIAIKRFTTLTVFGVKSNSDVILNTRNSVIRNHPISICHICIDETRSECFNGIIGAVILLFPNDYTFCSYLLHDMSRVYIKLNDKTTITLTSCPNICVCKIVACSS